MRTTCFRAAALPALVALGCGGEGGPALEIAAVEPARGSTLGGQTVQIEGRGFLAGPPTMVVFGDRSAPAVTPLGDGRLKVTIPAADAPGPVPVTVFNQVGVALAEDAFTYNDLPSVDSVEPATGDYRGGDTVTVEGSGFMENEPGTTRVLFDGIEAMNVTVMSDTSLEAIVPPGEPFKEADVTVENDNGAGTAGDAFEWLGVGLFAMASGGEEVGKLFFLDVDTGELVVINSQPAGVGGGTQGSVTGLAARDGSLFAISTAQDLLAVDRRTGALSEIGPLSDRVNDITFVGDTLYASSRFERDLFRLDTETGVLTEVADVDSLGSSGNGLATSDDGDVFISQGADLHTIDVNTGEISANPVSMPMQKLGALAFHQGDLYGVQPGFNLSTIWRINPANGEATLIATVPIKIDGLESTER